eukprot:7282096-Prymnesium_polylepis.1
MPARTGARFQAVRAHAVRPGVVLQLYHPVLVGASERRRWTGNPSVLQYGRHGQAVPGADAEAGRDGERAGRPGIRGREVGGSGRARQRRKQRAR